MIIDELITDRTKNDVVYGNPKGKYDFEDYNSVGEATNYVAQELINGSYDVSATAKTDWQNTDIPKDKITIIEDINKAVDYLENDRNEYIYVITCFSDKYKFISRIKGE